MPNGISLFLVHAESVLGLVENAISGAAVDLIVLLAAELIANRLGGSLGVVGLELTCHLIAGAGHVLRQLVGGALGAVRSDGFLGLCKFVSFTSTRSKEIVTEGTYCR